MTLLGSVLVVTGDDEYLRSRARTRALAQVCADAGGETLNLVRLEGASLTGADFAQATSPSLFGGVPVVFIADGQQIPKDTWHIVTRWSESHDSNSFVLVEVNPKPQHAAAKNVLSALVKSGAQVETLNTPVKGERVRFAMGELKRCGLTADTDAARILAECEPDLRGIVVRAEQIAADSGGNKRVSTEAMAAVVSSHGSASGFAVGDAVAARDVKAVVATVLAARQTGTPTVLIVSACMTALRDIAAIQAGLVGKRPPWMLDKARRNSGRWSPSSLGRAVAIVGGLHPAIGSSGRREADLMAGLVRAITQ